MDKEKLQEKLCKKLSNEYNKYISTIKKLSPDKIIESSYEIACKQEFTEMFIHADWRDKEEFISLLEQKNTLEFLYQDWLDSDGGIHNILEESMDIGINELVESRRKEFIENNPELLEKMEEAINELDNYSVCTHLKSRYNLKEINKENIVSIIEKGDAEYLYDFFNENTKNKQIQYLVGIYVFNPSVYNNMKNEILPSLNKFCFGSFSKEKIKQKDVAR